MRVNFSACKNGVAQRQLAFLRGRGRLVGQADLLTPIKAHADLSAWPAKINLVERVK
jgi:hypothetical protein